MKTVYTKNGATTNVVSKTQHLPVNLFTCTPNPCINRSDRKRPAAYSFSSTKTIWPYGRIYSEQNYNGDVFGVEKVGHFGTSFGTPIGAPGLASKLSECKMRALNKMYGKVRNSEVSLNTSIGEGRETLTMLRDIAVTARKVRKRLKKLSRDVAIDPLQTVGGLYLGWSVGLSPLLNDCENIRNHMANEDNDQIRIRPVNGRASAFQTSSTRDGFRKREMSERFQVGIRWRLANLHLFENWRLGLTVRPTLFWELTTLSFVYDYVLNVGQYLELLEASILNNGIEFIDGYETETVRTADEWKEDFSDSITKLQWSGPPVLRQRTIHSVNVEQRKVRRLLKSFPTPPLPVVKIPRASGPLLNVAALLSQILSRRAS